MFFLFELLETLCWSWASLAASLILCTTGLPCTLDQADDVVYANILLDLGKNCRTSLSDLSGIPLHNTQISANKLCQVGLVHDQQITLRNTRSTLSGDLVATADIDNVDDEIGQLAAVVCCEVVASRLNKEDIGVELAVQVFQCSEILGDVLSDSSVRATTSLNGADARRWESLVSSKELCVFAGEDVVCDSGEGVFLSESEGEGEHESGLSGADGTGMC
ncbi:hypothetical protein HG531_000240 [Fusarium graminearum]|nr:hypothetical protein HG531_000240 [Fusarium graminearum]